MCLLSGRHTGTFWWAQYCSYGPCAARGGSGSDGIDTSCPQLFETNNFRFKVCDFFFDDTFRWAHYCSDGSCATRGGQAATGSTLLFTNFLRRTTFLCRYMRFFFRYVPPYILGYVIRSFFRFAVTCSKKAGQKKIPFYKLVETDNFCL